MGAPNSITMHHQQDGIFNIMPGIDYGPIKNKCLVSINKLNAIIVIASMGNLYTMC